MGTATGDGHGVCSDPCWKWGALPREEGHLALCRPGLPWATDCGLRWVATWPVCGRCSSGHREDIEAPETRASAVRCQAVRGCSGRRQVLTFFLILVEHGRTYSTFRCIYVPVFYYQSHTASQLRAPGARSLSPPRLARSLLLSTCLQREKLQEFGQCHVLKLPGARASEGTYLSPS